MANFPFTPQSYQAILGTEVGTFLSNFGIPRLEVGSPILSILESTAQSIFRASNDALAIPRALDLQQSTGQALVNLASAEHLTPINAVPSNGVIEVEDTSFQKISSHIYVGLPAPIPGSTTIYLADGTGFPSGGTVYLGRGTSRYEGPLTYTGIANSGSYWTLTLSSPTVQYHNANESVVVGQGGNRLVSSGEIVQTSQSNTNTSLQFATLYDSTVPDGETIIQNVAVVCKTPGTISNIPAGAIVSFSSPPFNGATCTNLVAYANGLDQETEEALRERIENARQSKSLGTDLAITSNALGVTSTTENKQVVSASIYSAPGQPTTLYIDDGTGYEELDQGIANEVLYNPALGVEQYFKVQASLPVAKAFVASEALSPYVLTNGQLLTVFTGGVTYAHEFVVTDFQNINNATAFEVVASINADTPSPFTARVAESGTQVVIFSKADVDESLQVISDGSVSDSNTVFKFSTLTANTLNLFKNDRLLIKDGRVAVVNSNTQALWGSVSGSQTLTVAVDGTSAVTYTFTDSDFINNNTGYTTLASTNSLAAWCIVINAKIPGITATVNTSFIALTSNLGTNSRAGVQITGGTLISAQFFNVNITPVVGFNSDYVFDRNRGEGYLASPLAAGDSLILGTSDARPFVQSTVTIVNTTLIANNTAYFAVDGNATVITSLANGANNLTIGVYTLTPPDTSHVRSRLSSTTTNCFANVLEGDWIVLTDANVNTNNLGCFRVDYVDPSFEYVEWSRNSVSTQSTFSVSIGGITFVRTAAYLQPIVVPLGTYTAASLVTTLNAALDGAFAKTYRTNFVRIYTNTNDGGDIALVAATSEISKLGLFVNNTAVTSSTVNGAAAISSNSEIGTPSFSNAQVTVIGSPVNTNFTVSSVGQLYAANRLVVGEPLTPDVDSGGLRGRYGNNVGFHSSFYHPSSTQITVNKPVDEEWIVKDRMWAAAPYAIGPNDNLSVLVDGDTSSKYYVTNLYRNLLPTNATYSNTNSYLDEDNNGAILTTAFGTGFNFQDFTVYMHARAKSHAESGDTTKTVLWRWYRQGADGLGHKMYYVYPTLPSQSPTAFVDSTGNAAVALSSGASRAVTLRNSTHIGVILQNSGFTTNANVIFNLPIISATRTSGTTTTLTVDVSSIGASTSIGLASTNQPIYYKTTDPNFHSGYYIASTGASTITFTDPGTNVTSSGTGTVSWDTQEVSLSSSAIVTGDVFSFNSTTGLPSFLQQEGNRAYNITTNMLQTYLNATEGSTTTIVWYSLQNASGFNAFPLNSSNNQANLIAAAINTEAAITNNISPLTAVAVGDGTTNTGIIALASFEEFATVGYGYTLVDGVNYIRVSSTPGSPSTNYTLTFKKQITSALATNSDWAHEAIRLSPTTAQNVVDWLNSYGVTGLSSVADVTIGQEASSVQIHSKTLGSAGSIQVQGGLGNNAAGSVVGGSATYPITSGLQLTMKASDTLGFQSDKYFQITNAVATNKPLFTSTQELNSISTSGLFTFNNGTGPAIWSTSATAVTGLKWQFDIQNQFTVIRYVDTSGTPSITGVAEGDWLVISAGTVSPGNIGTFRIVRVDTSNDVIWIVNPRSVAEVSTPNLAFVTGTSLMPGDIFTLSSNLFGGINNARTYTVTNTFDQANGYIFKVSTNGVPLTAYSTPIVLNIASVFFVATEAQPTTVFKRLVSVAPNPVNGAFSDLGFDTIFGQGIISAANGATVTALDKLEFPTTTIVGIDGYNHAIGLIGQVNLVEYGDPNNPTAYPGVIAADSYVNISAPIIRRIQASFSVRTILNVDPSNVIEQVQAAVAAVVNQSPVGQSIAISSLIDVASTVNGVLSVAIVSPVYNSSNDLIVIGQQEKALVLNVADIGVVISNQNS